MTFFLTGVAGAKSSETTQAEATKPEAALEGEVGDITEAGSRLKEARTKLDVAESRSRDLDRKTQDLQTELETQKQSEATSRDRLEKSVKAAYKGQDIADATLVLNSFLSRDGAKLGAVLGGPAGRMLSRGRESIQFRQDSQQALKDTIRRLDQKKKEYKESRGEQRDQIDELRRRETQLVASVGGSGPKREQMEARIAELEAADQAGELTMPPASGGAGSVSMDQELEIAQEDIVAQPVEPIPYERYVQIYKASAKRYDFERDWYVLAAVGKIESNHGENMGPSSAGAMGPMQFLPSTWREYGVDGNKDGDKNIMDPEDAIPAAAAYLKEGGAPDDWDAALYTYNHAGWYVREVLGVAEGYRKLAKDDEVEPYV